MFKVLIYDDDKKSKFGGVIAHFKTDNIYDEYSYRTFDIDTTYIPNYSFSNICFQARISDKGEAIELDETTMKKIAKHNKDAEFEKINKDIKKLKEEKLALEKEVKTLEQLKEALVEYFE